VNVHGLLCLANLMTLKEVGLSSEMLNEQATHLFSNVFVFYSAQVDLDECLIQFLNACSGCAAKSTKPSSEIACP
jgi:hypothetical protein